MNYRNRMWTIHKYAVIGFGFLALLSGGCSQGNRIVYQFDRSILLGAASIVFNFYSDKSNKETTSEHQARVDMDYYSVIDVTDARKLSYEIFTLDPDRCKLFQADGQTIIESLATDEIRLDLQFRRMTNQPCEINLSNSSIDEIRIMTMDSAKSPNFPHFLRTCAKDQTCVFYADSETPINLMQSTSAVDKIASWNGTACADGRDSCEYRIEKTANRLHKEKREINVVASTRPYSRKRLDDIPGWWAYTPLGRDTTMNAVFGIDGNAVWAVGNNGTIIHWDGKGWVQEKFVTEEKGVCSSWAENRKLCNLYAVWGERKDSEFTVWAVGENGLVLRREKGIWSEVPGVQAVIGPVSAKRRLPVNLRAVWGFGNDEIVIAGSLGTILYINSTAQVQMISAHSSMPKDSQGLFFTSIWGRNGTCFWVAGDRQTVLRWGCHGAATWNRESLPSIRGIPDITEETSKTIEQSPIWSLWGAVNTGLTQLWAVGGQGTILSFDGTSWKRTQLAADDSGRPQFRGIWGYSPNDIWAVGNFARIYHWNGSLWNGEKIEFGGQYGEFAGHFSKLWIAPDGRIWISGSRPQVLRSADSPADRPSVTEVTHGNGRAPMRQIE